MQEQEKADASFRGSGWRLVWKILRRHRGLTISIVALTLGVYVSSLSVPILTQKIIDGITSGRPVTAIALLGALAAAMSVLDVGLADVRARLVRSLARQMEAQVSMAIMSRMLGARMDLADRDTGAILNKAGQTAHVRIFLVDVIPSAAFSIGAAFLAAVMIFMYSVYCGLIVLVIAGTGFFLSQRILNRYYDLYTGWNKLNGERYGLLSETVGGLPTIKALAVEPGRFRQWARITKRFVDSDAVFRNVLRRFFGVTALSDHVLTLCVVAAGGYQMMRGELTAGDLFAVLMLAGRISKPLLNAADIARQWQEVSVAVTDVGSLLDRPAETARARPAVRQPLTGGIEFRNVTYRYHGAAVPAVSGLNLRLPGEGLCALIGRNGSGKSTLLKLVQGFLREFEGEVLVGGVSVLDYQPRWLRSRMAMVNQDTVLFAGTVRENVTCWTGGISDDAITAALRLAGAWEFVEALPEKLDAKLTEDGANLSGGQRQRLSVARAVLRDPEIVLLDEPTAFLDAEAAVGLETRLAAWGRGRLTILVSHHLAATRLADTIILMDEGKVAAQGTHAELLASWPQYQTMWRNYLRESGAAEGMDCAMV